MDKSRQLQSNIELTIIVIATICLVPFIVFSIGTLATSTSIFEDGVHIILLAYVIVMCVTGISMTVTIARDNALVEYNKARLKQLIMASRYNLSLFISPSIEEKLKQSNKLIRDYELRKYATAKSNSLNIGTNPGYIYIMRRADGVYKLGRTNNTEYRQRQHVADYGDDFILVTRFVVPDAVEFEKLALSMTSKYFYNELGRQELRQMTDKVLHRFIAEFERICEVSVRL